jgi:hypothetical protein
MAQQPSPIEFEYIPLAHARQLARGPRLDPELSQTLKSKIQSLSAQAIRMTLPEGVRFLTMKNRILRIAAEIKPPVTIRRLAGGLTFWRSTDEDIQQAREIAERLQGARRRRRTRPDRRRRSRS